jgi:hypothetical protein
MTTTSRLIINLRGANGTGKSTLARLLLKHKSGEDLPFDKFPVYRCEIEGVRRPIYVLGRYLEGVQTGGCDTITNMDTLEHYVEWCVNRYAGGHVFFEGVRISTSGTRWMEAAFDWEKQRLGSMLWAFILAPDKVARLRTQERNGGKVPAPNHCGVTVRNIYKRFQEVFPEQIAEIDWRCTPQESYQSLLDAIRERQ